MLHRLADDAPAAAVAEESVEGRALSPSGAARGLPRDRRGRPAAIIAALIQPSGVYTSSPTAPGPSGSVTEPSS